MSDKIQKLTKPEGLPVTPVGDLMKGWTAGTYVYFVDASVNPAFKLAPGTVAMVDKWTSREGASGTKPNRQAGFMWHGSQKISNGDIGEETYWLTAKEPGNFLEFDDNKQLKYIGTSSATMVLSGNFKTYVFEKKDSFGVDLIYAPTDLLYVSDNNIWTKEVFISGGITGDNTGYQVANIGSDEEGDFLIITGV